MAAKGPRLFKLIRKAASVITLGVGAAVFLYGVGLATFIGAATFAGWWAQ